MKAIYQTGIHKFEVQEVPKPSIKDDEVLFQVKAVGICGSDVHYWNEGRIGDQVVKYPFILGHESSGKVAAVGKAIKDLKPGMKAAFEPGLACGQCEICRGGRYNACPDVKFLGTPPIEGAFREFMVGKRLQILPLPESVSMEEGALLEPFSVGVYSVRYAGFRVADTAVVIGAGPIGLSTLAALKAAGAGTLILTEKRQYRIKFAEYLGLDGYVDANRADTLEQVKAITHGKGADFVFEAAGSPDGFYHAVEMARIGGTVVLTGICEQDDISMPMHMARRKELVLKLIRREAFGYKPALKLVEKGLAKVDHWVTHRYSISQIDQAFDTVHAYKDGVIKAVIEF